MSVKKVVIGLLLGGVLGIVCILGANIRSSEPLAGWYLFAFWLNRFLMGFVFALLPLNPSLVKKLFRGLIIGLLISFTFYAATNYSDFLGFVVGGLYGLIIELVFHYVFRSHKHVS